MSNVYCTTAQFFDRYDQRTASQLTNDRGDGTVLLPRLQNLLDSNGSMLESVLQGRYSLPLTVIPALLTNYVADKTMIQLYGRRQDMPSALSKMDTRWDAWMDALIEGKVGLPGVSLANGTLALVAAENSGQTQFDRLPDFNDAFRPYPNWRGIGPNFTPQE